MPEGEVFVEAYSSACDHIEESKTDVDGTYRIRGLLVCHHPIYFITHRLLYYQIYEYLLNNITGISYFPFICNIDDL